MNALWHKEIVHHIVLNGHFQPKKELLSSTVCQILDLFNIIYRCIADMSEYWLL